MMQLETPLVIEPLAENHRTALDHLLTVNRIHRRILNQLENTLPHALSEYRRRRHYYENITDLAVFRHDFFATIGSFLSKTTQIRYQLAFQDAFTHSKRSYRLQELRQLNANTIVRGTVTETLDYPVINVKIRRIYTVQNHHLYRDKCLFEVDGHAINELDGLACLKKRLEVNSYWLKHDFLNILAYT